jgi:predicted NUDIX family phosphoesterase
MKEKVLVFDAKHMSLFSKELPGLSRDPEDLIDLKYACAGDNGFFEDRAAAEGNENLKQVIPYMVVRRGEEILAYQRSDKSGEGRLHNKWSVGFGGHVNESDKMEQGILFTLSMAMGRELNEELDWGDQEKCTVENISELGVLYDDSDPVGRVHIGYVLVIDVPKDAQFPKAKEDTIAATKWVPLKDAIGLPGLEGWGRIVVEAMSAK